tara:strand:+ start:144 stop:314 length:171 start_codon:yes stop_codon:yes gene_type:complete
MKVKLLRDKYMVADDGSDSVGRIGDVVDVDKETAEVWLRRGHAESASEKKSSTKKD